MPGMLAKEDGDWRRRADRRRCRGQARPSDVAGQRQQIQQRRIVAIHSGRQDRPLPRRRRRLEAVEQRDDGAEAVDAGQTAALVHVLPREQKAHEVGGVHRLDFRAQAIERVAMDARQQRTVAPLDRRVSLTASFERAAKNDPLGLQRQQPGVGILDRHAKVVSELRSRGRTAAGQAAAQQLDDRLLTRPASGRAR